MYVCVLFVCVILCVFELSCVAACLCALVYVRVVCSAVLFVVSVASVVFVLFVLRSLFVLLVLLVLLVVCLVCCVCACCGVHVWL